MVDKGATEEECWNQMFGTMSRHFKAYDRYKQVTMKSKSRREETKLEFHYGEPHVGKTTGVAKKYDGAYWLSPGKYWSDYEGEKVVVLDEFKGWVPAALFKRLFDCTPLSVEVKYGSRQMVAERVVLISNYMPERWYKEENEELQKAVDERIMRASSEIWWWKEKWQPPVKITLQDLRFEMFKKAESRPAPEVLE